MCVKAPEWIPPYPLLCDCIKSDLKALQGCITDSNLPMDAHKVQITNEILDGVRKDLSSAIGYLNLKNEDCETNLNELERLVKAFLNLGQIPGASSQDGSGASTPSTLAPHSDGEGSISSRSSSDPVEQEDVPLSDEDKLNALCALAGKVKSFRCTNKGEVFEREFGIIRLKCRFTLLEEEGRNPEEEGRNPEDICPDKTEFIRSVIGNCQ